MGAGGRAEEPLRRLACNVAECRAAVRVGQGWRIEAAYAWGVNPVLSIILKLGKQPANIKAGPVTQLVVERAAKAEARAVIPVFTLVVGVDARERPAARKWIHTHTWFHVVNAAAVPVVAPTGQDAQLLVLEETLAHGQVELVERAPPGNRRVSTHSQRANVRFIACTLGHQIDRSADSIAFLVGGERLAELNHLHQIGWNRVQFHVADVLR